MHSDNTISYPPTNTTAASLYAQVKPTQQQINVRTYTTCTHSYVPL
ncbi:hypothetical protein HMPREF3190_01148 [Umbribacter vaginalis]|nr:hypothetical protein HMPREF3190_01148 [Coriobacteriales bacterium DNF00809]